MLFLLVFWSDWGQGVVAIPDLADGFGGISFKGLVMEAVHVSAIQIP